MSDYEVTLINDNMQEFYVRFVGPTETPFEGGVWKIHVELPDQYPYKSPSIGFVNKIFHPNIDELSGSVCLDVINQTWSPMFGKCTPHLFHHISPDLDFLRDRQTSVTPLRGRVRDAIRLVSWFWQSSHRHCLAWLCMGLGLVDAFRRVTDHLGCHVDNLWVPE